MQGILDANGNDLKDAGTTIWDSSAGHVPAENVEQGAGSGLDADTLDGSHRQDVYDAIVTYSRLGI